MTAVGEPGNGWASSFVEGPPRIAYDIAGAGPLVVFLHGIGGNRSNWRDQLSAVAEHFTAVAWDARGYGDSDDYDGPLAFGDFSVDLERLLDHLGSQRAHLVGLSMGGRIAQHFYLTRPERVATLTLADTHPGFAHLTPEQRADYLRSRQEPLLAGRQPREIAPGLVARLIAPDADDGVMRRLFESIAALRKESYLKSLEATVMQDHIGDLGSIAVPTHFVVGACDSLTTPALMQEMAAQVEGAQLTVIEGAGHLSNMEQPERFNTALLGFLMQYVGRADAPGDG